MTKTLQRQARLLIGVAIILPLAGCVQVSDSLVDPATATVDPNLIGTWTGTNSSVAHTIYTYTISSTGDGGLMQDTWTSEDTQTGKVTEGLQSVFVATTINGHGYICDFGPGSKSTTYSTKNCRIVQYIVTGDTLQEDNPDDTAAGKLVAAQTIIGTATTDTMGYTTYTLDRDSLVQYLNENSGNELFPSEATGQTLLRRVVATTPNTTPSAPAPITSPQDTAPAPSAPPTPPPPPADSTPASDTTQSNGSGPGFFALLPWFILVFIGGVFVARKFSRRG